MRHGSSQVSIYLVICVSLHVNIFMDVGVSNRYTTEMQRMLFCFISHFTAAFNLERIKSLYQLYVLNNVNNLLVENHFLEYGLLLKWCHTTPLTKTKKADFHQYLNFSYHVLGCIVSEQNENWVNLNVMAFLILESHFLRLTSLFTHACSRCDRTLCISEMIII